VTFGQYNVIHNKIEKTTNSLRQIENLIQSKEKSSEQELDRIEDRIKDIKGQIQDIMNDIEKQHNVVVEKIIEDEFRKMSGLYISCGFSLASKKLTAVFEDASDKLLNSNVFDTEEAEINISEEDDTKITRSADNENSVENQSTSIENSILINQYSGTLGNKTFKLEIEKVDDDNIEGYNITGEKRRPVKGFVLTKWLDVDDTKVFNLVLNEPGDDEWDGKFYFTIYFSPKGNGGRGEWKSFNGKLKREISINSQYISE
jgi:flagellar biosynthesis GTPase FlhF